MVSTHTWPSSLHVNVTVCPNHERHDHDGYLLLLILDSLRMRYVLQHYPEGCSITIANFPLVLGAIRLI